MTPSAHSTLEHIVIVIYNCQYPQWFCVYCEKCFEEIFKFIIVESLEDDIVIVSYLLTFRLEQQIYKSLKQ